MGDKIKTILIFEMLGRPAEHLKNTLFQFIDKISQEKGVEVVNKKIHEPKRLEEAKEELYTTFAETEFNFQDLPSMLKIVFMYMPSHIEIIDPEELRIKNFDLNVLMSELARKLHQYDEITKRLAIERNILYRQLQEQGIQPAIQVLGQQAQQKVEEVKKEKKKKAEKKKSKKKAAKKKKK